MSEVVDASDRLRAAWSGLSGNWHDARGHWRDAVGDSFERRVWNAWEAEIPQLVRALDDLNEALSQAVQQTE